MSFLGSALGAVTGGISSIIGGALSNSAARHAATVANQRNVYNYQQRYQWSMQDMQKAGLNPMLAATQGIGGSVNGASALSANYNLGEGVTAGKTIANKLAQDTYKDNVALYKQNLVNAQKQGFLIDEQTKNALYQRDVVMPAQANMMLAQGNAANSSAAYNAQLSNVAKADYDYKTSRNSDYKNLGLSDDGLPWNTVGRAANRLFSGIANYFSK
jgi:hypothetical protein